jgi:hypothetical protein
VAFAYRSDLLATAEDVVGCTGPRSCQIVRAWRPEIATTVAAAESAGENDGRPLLRNRTTGSILIDGGTNDTMDVPDRAVLGDHQRDHGLSFPGRRDSGLREL